MFRLLNVSGRSALEVDGAWYDLARLSGDDALADPMAAVGRSAELHALTVRCADATADGQVADTVLGPPVPRPRQVFAIGLNYADHAAESGMEAPPAPLTFTKFPSSIAGPDGGRPPLGRARRLGGRDRRRHRTCLQPRAGGGGLGRPGRGDPRPGHLGPPGADDRDAAAVLPRQELPGLCAHRAGRSSPSTALADPDDIALWCDVSGERMQDSRSANLIFSIPTLVAYLSSICPLEPGDIIFTGTPDGVGMARGRFLAPGDVVVSGAEGIGELRNALRRRDGALPAMSLHRLLGLDAVVPDPAALAAFYAELGLGRDAASGFTGTDGGGVVRVSEGPFRRLASVGVGCQDEAELASIVARLTDGGADATVSDGVLSVVDPASRVRFDVRPTSPAPVQAPPTLVVPNAPGVGGAGRPSGPPPCSTGPRPPRRLGHLVIGTPDLAATRDVAHRRARVQAERRGRRGHRLPPLLDRPPQRGARRVARAAAAALLLGVRRHRPCRPHRHRPLPCRPGSPHVGDGAPLRRLQLLLVPARPGRVVHRALLGPGPDPRRRGMGAGGRTEFTFEHVANSWGPNLPLEFIVPADLGTLQAGLGALAVVSAGGRPASTWWWSGSGRPARHSPDSAPDAGCRCWSSNATPGSSRCRAPCSSTTRCCGSSRSLAAPTTCWTGRSSTTASTFLTADRRTLLSASVPPDGRHGLAVVGLLPPADLRGASCDDAVAAAGVTVRAGVEVVAMTRTSTASTWGSPTGRPSGRATSSGATGPDRPPVRIGSALHDTGFEESWLVVDLLLAADVPGLPTRCLQVCDPARPHTLVPMPGAAVPLRVHVLPGESEEDLRRDDVIADLDVRRGSTPPRHGRAVGGLHVPRPGGRGLARPADLPGRRRRPPDARRSSARACAPACATPPTWPGSWPPCSTAPPTTACSTPIS